MIKQLFYITSGITSLAGISNKIKTDAFTASYNKFDEITKPKYSITILMLSYNEEHLIKYAVESIREQNIIKAYPEYFEFVLVDSYSEDKTVEIAKNCVDKIIYTPKGKLTARNLSLPYSNGNIIVSVDADCYYPPNWLNLLLKDFNNDEVVAVSGITVDYHPNLGILNIFSPLAYYLQLKILQRYRLYGRNSAYYKYLHIAEPFDESINQFDINEVMQEEEINFGNKISKYGNIVFNRKACCIHLGGIKGACRYGYIPKSEVEKIYCEQIKKHIRFG